MTASAIRLLGSPTLSLRPSANCSTLAALAAPFRPRCSCRASASSAASTNFRCNASSATTTPVSKGSVRATSTTVRAGEVTGMPPRTTTSRGVSCAGCACRVLVRRPPLLIARLICTGPRIGGQLASPCSAAADRWLTIAELSSLGYVASTSTTCRCHGSTDSCCSVGPYAPARALSQRRPSSAGAAAGQSCPAGGHRHAGTLPAASLGVL